MTPDLGASVAIRESLARIADYTGTPSARLGPLEVAHGPQPQLALLNFERWLHVTSSPGMQLENALAAGEHLGELLTLMGSSQALADLFIQNPELSHLVLEPETGSLPTRSTVLAEGRALLAGATSPSHALDRLRFLKQRWTVPIVVADLFGPVPQELVWRALSDLADALIELAYEAVSTGAGDPLPPMGIVAFGKLGGRELNYSSDVDLVYVGPEGLDEREERRLIRFAEAFGRALSDRTGRGGLYRVDLRLRPYSSAGALTPSMAAIEAYYERYAEPWEVQAHLRSRVVVGGDELRARWDSLREATCFKAQLGEPALEAMISMRGRIEEYASEGDLKRGSGGIRDVEFLVQLLQLVHGHNEPDLRVLGTLEALRACDRHGVLDHAVCLSASEGYTFLRKLEHRCQLLGDQQTHELPSDPIALETVSRLMGFRDPAGLTGALSAHRRTLQVLYKSVLQQNDVTPGIETVRDALTERLGPAGLAWFDSFPLSGAFYDALSENQASLARVERILRHAPALVPPFRQSMPLTELLLSGELEEGFDGAAVIDALPTDWPVDRLAESYSAVHTKTVGRWVLAPTEDLGDQLARLADSLLRHACRRLYADVDVLALGSYARFELAPASDLDLIWLVDVGARQPAAEAAVQSLIGLLGRLRRMGAPVEIDLRLRPDGGKGLLVRSYKAIKAYDLEGMELWERFALGQARLVAGATRAATVVREAAYGLPLTPDRLAELVAMKRRIETERVKPQHKYRDVKLGRGGLGDIEWFVHLHEMRYPTALDAGALIRMPDRIRALMRASLINAVESAELLEAQEHFVRVRYWLQLQGIEGAIVPENPDKLARLADAMGYPEGNVFLARHEAMVIRIRQIYEEGLARLRA